MSSNGQLPPTAAFCKTIVTSELFRKIAETYGGLCADVLTGFKYVAEQIRRWEEQGEHQFLFGGEESYGYLRGTHVRDKDAVISCALVCEAALQAKLQGLTLIDQLHQIYRQYGVFREGLVSVKFPETQQGRQQMIEGMKRLRSSPPRDLGGISVSSIIDYSDGYEGLPPSDVLRFFLADGSWIVVRPSGTEPKVKLYGGVERPVQSDLDLDIAAADAQCLSMLKAMEQQIV